MRLTTISTICIFALMLVVGCGGGGSSDPGPTYTYFQQGGLTWSSPTAAEHGYLQSDGFTGTPEFICTGETNGVPANFNKTRGWRLPTFSELLALYRANPNPPGWNHEKVWDNNGGGIDFSDGSFFQGNGNRAHVTCVK